MIDADVHATAPDIEALAPYLSAHWRDYLQEHGFRRTPGVAVSYPLKSMFMDGGASASKNVGGLSANVFERSSHAIVSCYYGIESVRHPYMASALATAVNSWLQSEWLDREPRLFACAALPLHAPELAVQEIKRIASDRRFVQIYFPARTWEPYGNQHYWPIYEAAIEANLAVGIHAGGLSGMPPTAVGPVDTTFEEFGVASQLFAAHILSFIAEGVFDRFPELRLALMESGVTWLPTWLWRMDTEWKAARREVPWVRQRPTEYVRRHVRLTVQPLDAPDSLAELELILGQLDLAELLMYSSDFPHDHSGGPDQLLSLLDSEQRSRVLRENAWTFYGLGDRS